MICVVGDLHFRDRLSYSDHVDRTKERDEVLDFIVDQAKDCDTVVSLGDVFDRRDPPAAVTRDAVRFFERFEDKKLYIISGNHDKKASGGTTALDFMGEIEGKHWKIFTKPTRVPGVGHFLPHMYKSELGDENDRDGATTIHSELEGMPHEEILFHHHAVSDTFANGIDTGSFNEIVLDKNQLEAHYGLIIGGHIHSPGVYGKTIVTGSVFNSDMGETGKSIWKIDEKTLSVREIKLPGRGIYKLTNPTDLQIDAIPCYNIVKVIITNPEFNIDHIREKLKKHDAYLIVEQYPSKREKIHFEDGAMDLDVNNLIKIYAEAKKVNINLLSKGFELIN